MAFSSLMSLSRVVRRKITSTGQKRVLRSTNLQERPSEVLKEKFSALGYKAPISSPCPGLSPEATMFSFFGTKKTPRGIKGQATDKRLPEKKGDYSFVLSDGSNRRGFLEQNQNRLHPLAANRTVTGVFLPVKHATAESWSSLSGGSPAFYSVLTTASSPSPPYASVTPRSPPEELLTGHGGFLGQNQNRHNRTETGVFLPPCVREKPMVATVLVPATVVRSSPCLNGTSHQKLVPHFEGGIETRISSVNEYAIARGKMIVAESLKGNGRLVPSPTSSLAKGMHKTDSFQQLSEVDEDEGLGRPVALFPLALQNFEKMLKSAAKNKSEETHLELGNVVKSHIITAPEKTSNMAKTERKPAETRLQGSYKILYKRSFCSRPYYKPIKPLLPSPPLRREDYKDRHDYIAAIKNHQPTFREVEDERKRKELKEEIERKKEYSKLAGQALRKVSESEKLIKLLEEEVADRATFKKFWEDKAAACKEEDEKKEEEEKEKKKKKKKK